MSAEAMTSRFLPQVEPVIGEAEQKAVAEYLASGGWLTEYTRTTEFERRLADFLGVRHAVVVPNGTVSLTLALMALGVGPGDEVLVPDFTMIASANAVLLAGATPRFVDVEASTLCADLSRAVVTPQTRALMYVPLNGRSGDMDVVCQWCKAAGIALVEDAAQALGSRWRGRPFGTFGDIASFSFSPHKIVTTGQGGAAVTNRDDLSQRLRWLKDFGRRKSGVDEHIALGFNFKFTDLQAVIGIEQMNRIGASITRKKDIYAAYRSGLDGVRGIGMVATALEDVAPWFMDVLCDGGRDALMAHLQRQSFGTRPFYPAVHSQAPYRQTSDAFPVSDDVAKRGCWLPSGLGLEPKDVDNVCRAIREYFTAGR